MRTWREVRAAADLNEEAVAQIRRDLESAGFETDADASDE